MASAGKPSRAGFSGATECPTVWDHEAAGPVQLPKALPSFCEGSHARRYNVRNGGNGRNVGNGTSVGSEGATSCRAKRGIHSS